MAWDRIENILKNEKPNRICCACNLGQIGNETHMIFDCPLYDSLRQNCFSLFQEAADFQSFMSRDLRKLN